MSRSFATGEWFLPGNTNKMSGNLKFSKSKGIILSIYGDKSLDGQFMKDSFTTQKSYFHDIILGVGYDNITLYDCKWIRTKPIGQGLYQIKYRANFMIHGGHINTITDLHIKSATLLYPNLASWYEGWQGGSKLTAAGEYDESKYQSENSSEVESFVTTENLSLSLTDSYYKGFPEFGVHHSIIYEKLLHFKYKKLRNLWRLISRLIYIRKIDGICKR